MKILVVIVAFILFACACGPKCPTCPTLRAEGVAPAPIVTVAPRAVCNLPALPQPFDLVGMATPDGIVITKSDMAPLVGYLVAVRAWINAAQICIEARR
jgi:hypothetical protein